MTAPSTQRIRDKDEVYRLIQTYQEQPTEEVKTTLVLHFENLVRSLAHRFSKGDELFEDLTQVGMIGLLAALNRYDFSQGRNFESFAIPTIVGEMKRYIRDKTWSVHVPRRIKELGPQIKKTVEKLTAEQQRSPTIAEIAERVQATEEEILEAMEMSRSYRALSFDNRIETDQEGSTVTLLDLIGRQDRGYEDVNHRLLFDKILKALNEKEQQVIQLTFIQHLSQQQAGEKMNISQMHVSRLQRRALQKLREMLSDADGLQEM